jgi:hypothetical protein
VPAALWLHFAVISTPLLLPLALLLTPSQPQQLLLG